MNNKATIYREIIMRSLQEQWTRIEKMMNTLPEGEHLEWDELTTQDQLTIDNIKAIEAEWIMDDKIRNELTVLQDIEDDEQ